MRSLFTSWVSLLFVLFLGSLIPSIVNAERTCPCDESPGAARFDVDGDPCGECWPENNCVYSTCLFEVVVTKGSMDNGQPFIDWVRSAFQLWESLRSTDVNGIAAVAFTEMSYEDMLSMNRRNVYTIWLVRIPVHRDSIPPELLQGLGDVIGVTWGESASSPELGCYQINQMTAINDEDWDLSCEHAGALPPAQVIAHEIGHAIGMEHQRANSLSNSIMDANTSGCPGDEFESNCTGGFNSKDVAALKCLCNPMPTVFLGPLSVRLTSNGVQLGTEFGGRAPASAARVEVTRIREGERATVLARLPISIAESHWSALDPEGLAEDLYEIALIDWDGEVIATTSERPTVSKESTVSGR